MSLEVTHTCPLGHICEEAKDGKIYRCRWYVSLKGNDPQTDEPIDEFRCSMEWQPLLQVEGAGFQRHASAAVEGLRNVFLDALQKPARIDQGAKSLQKEEKACISKEESQT